jgi:S1-C subfamily serine protease
MWPDMRLVGAAVVVGAVALYAARAWHDEGPALRGQLVPEQRVSDLSTPKSVPAPAVASVPAPTPAATAPDKSVVPDSRHAVRLSFAPIVKRVAPAVVNVYATSRVQVRSPYAGDPFFERFFGGGAFGQPQERARSSLGSGVIVDAQGLVVTNNHVVSDATEVKVALADGREYQADMLIRDERSDLAVL